MMLITLSKVSKDTVFYSFVTDDACAHNRDHIYIVWLHAFFMKLGKSGASYPDYSEIQDNFLDVITSVCDYVCLPSCEMLCS